MPNESIHDEIKRERDAYLPEAEKTQIYRDYAVGNQRGTISADQMAILLSLTGHDHADNICDTVIATGASRLELLSFDCENSAVQNYLAGQFTRNAVAELQYDTHYAMGRDGNHAISLSWLPDVNGAGEPQPGAGRVVYSHEPIWDGKTGVFVAFELDGRTPRYAVKDFRVWIGNPPRDRLRRVIWFPDHIERYIRDGAGWAPFQLPTDPDNGVIEWRKRDGSPLGVPVVLFANGRFGQSPYGASDLAGGIIGLQDEINDFQRDLSAAGRLTAYLMYWVTGHDLVAKPVTVGPGQFVYSSSPDAEFGSFPPGSLEQIIVGLNTKIQTIARGTQTPQHIITGGDWPSGEALIRADIPLIDRTNRNIRGVGPSWATVAHRDTEMVNAFGRGAFDEDALIVPAFAPPERLDEMTLMQIEELRINQYLALRELGYSLRAIWKKMGLTEPEMNEMENQRKAELAMTGQTAPFNEPPPE